MDLLSQHEAFLRAIFDAPDDDTPRLVYADFLQENGEEVRAVLIRRGCEAARRATARPGGPALRDCPRGFRTPWKTATVTPDQLLDATGFRGHLVRECPECFAAEGVRICGRRVTSAEPFDAVFSLAAFARVTELNLEGELVEVPDPDAWTMATEVRPVVTTAGVEALARHRGVRRLTSMILTNNDLDNDAARALVKSPYLDNLKRLQLLDGNRLRGKVWQQVIERFGEDVAGNGPDTDGDGMMHTMFALAALVAADPALTAKVEKADPPAKLAAPVRKLLDPEALVVRRGDAVVMRVWFRTEVPVKATDEQVKNGLTYREIPEGSLVGAVDFPEAFTDYRKQELPAGAYTLRFAVQPDVGDHTGTSPHPDFCLLCRAADDKDSEPVEVKKLIEVSSKVNEGRHPAVLLLWPNHGKDAGVKVLDKGDGVFVATVRRAVAAGDRKATLGFAVTVAGFWKQ